MRTARMANSHDKVTNKNSAPIKSISCLTTLCQDDSGAVRKTSSGIAEQFVEARARNLRPEKIGDQPGFDAFEFAGFDDGFDLLEIGVPRADDHSVDGMLVEHVHELLDGGFAEAQFADHGDAFVQSLPQFTPEPRNFGVCADQDEAALVLGLAELAAQGPPDQFLLHIDQGETDDAKKRHHRARRNEC